MFAECECVFKENNFWKISDMIRHCALSRVIRFCVLISFFDWLQGPHQWDQGQ